jgi:hypothetical protein
MRDRIGSKRSPRQALLGSGTSPNGHTNRSTESCGTSVILQSHAVLRSVGRSFQSSGKRPDPTVVPRDCEARAFVCMEQRQCNAFKGNLGERFVYAWTYASALISSRSCNSRNDETSHMAITIPDPHIPTGTYAASCRSNKFS